MKAQLEWVSVRDGFPNDCETVLLYTTELGVVIGHWNPEGAIDLFWIHGVDVGRDDVTHWMPLPSAAQREPL